MLHQLPAEIALQVVSYLPLHSLYSITLVSHDWNALVAVNEAIVYRNAAIFHRFTEEDKINAGSVPVDWKAHCRRQLEVERGWRGKAPSIVRELTATGIMVHRIKADYELGFVITTYQIGGLSVCDIKNNRVLWALPPSHTVQYAHLEYDRGYIVFNRFDNCKEVWRRAADFDADQHPETSPPDKEMLDVSIEAATKYDSAECYWGHFKAWALLRLPENSRAFRLSYPTLLAVAANNAYLWDVRRSRLVSVLRDIQQRYHTFQLAAINYVEVNDLYVFICGAGGLRIFGREGGTLLYQLSTTALSSTTWDVLPQTRGLVTSVIHPQILLYNVHPPDSYLSDSEFMACHVSTSGNDLAALTKDGRLVILPGFQRLFSGPNAVHHRDTAIILNFSTKPLENDISCYLAVGGQNGKLAIATQRGIYVISPDFDFTRLTADCPPEPGVFVCRLSKFENDRLLSLVSCLQITHDAIYFTYPPSQTGGLLDATDHALVPGAGVEGPDLEVVGVMGDEPADLENVAFEDGEGDIGLGEIDVAPQNNWFLPTAPNTVYSVSF